MRKRSTAGLMGTIPSPGLPCGVPVHQQNKRYPGKTKTRVELRRLTSNPPTTEYALLYTLDGSDNLFYCVYYNYILYQAARGPVFGFLKKPDKKNVYTCPRA